MSNTKRGRRMSPVQPIAQPCAGWDVSALERQLRTEPQLNRKVELRRALKTKQTELEQQR